MSDLKNKITKVPLPTNRNITQVWIRSRSVAEDHGDNKSPSSLIKHFSFGDINFVLLGVVAVYVNREVVFTC